MALTQVRTGGVKDDAITSGKIPNNAVGTTEIADESISLAKLPHGDGSTNGKFLRSNTGADPTWEAVSSSDATKMPLAGGTFTGDVVFDNQANAGRDITWDESNDALEFADLAKAEFGTDGDSKIWFTGSGLFIENGTGHTTFTAQAGYGFSFLSGTDQLFEILAGANRVAFRKPIYIQGPDADTGGQITLYESNSVLDNYVVLEANGTMGANYTFTLPADGGSANQYLKTDGSGGTSWATVSAGAGGATALSLNDGVKVNFGADNDLRIEGGSGNSVIQHQDTGAGDLYIDAQNSNIYLRSGDGSTGEENAIVCENNGKVKLYHSGSDKLETTASGIKLNGLLEGTTDAATSTHSLPVTVNSWGWRFYQNSSSSPYGLEIKYSGMTRDDSVGEFINCLDTTAVRFKVTSDGDVWNHDDSYSGSDQTLKENIVDASSKLEDLKKLKVRNFNWKADQFPNRSKKKMLGFIAQEVEEVFPSLIKEYNITGDNDNPVMKKAIKQAWAPILVKALQEAVAKIEALETKVAALEAA